jgi:predicted DNA-binding protein YlxM (UPF0122 family)
MLLKGDLHLVVDLLETMQLSEVAEKWEVGTRAITNFLKKNGTSISKIRENLNSTEGAL